MLGEVTELPNDLSIIHYPSSTFCITRLHRNAITEQRSEETGSEAARRIRDNKRERADNSPGPSLPLS
jgi:hypothetical protein